MLKLVEVTSGYVTNWHSILEQTTGLFNGIGIAVAMRGLARRTEPVDLEDSALGTSHSKAVLLAVAFVIVAIPYVNLRKNVADWTSAGAVPQAMYGISAWAWFDLAAVAVAAALAILMARHLRRPLAFVPENPLGQGQGLFLLLLAIMVIGNFERALVGFKEARLVTEGVIHLNALLCAVILLTADPVPDHQRQVAAGQSPPARWHRLVAMGLAAGADRDPGRLGDRARRVRRPLCRARRTPHPLRTKRHDQRTPELSLNDEHPTIIKRRDRTDR